ncbi:unnamed protein product [Ixodes persulcatus]
MLKMLRVEGKSPIRSCRKKYFFGSAGMSCFDTVRPVSLPVNSSTASSTSNCLAASLNIKTPVSPVQATTTSLNCTNDSLANSAASLASSLSKFGQFRQFDFQFARYNSNTNIHIQTGFKSSFSIGLKKVTHGNLSTRLAKILFAYRRTPLVDGTSPSQRLLGYQIRSRLDSCLPFPGASSMPLQEPRSKLWPGDPVWARNFGEGEKWLPGTVTTTTGARMVSVDTPLGEVRRHMDQIRSREPLAAKAQDTAAKTTRPARDDGAQDTAPRHPTTRVAKVNQGKEARGSLYPLGGRNAV